jgi:mxaJ protein
MRSAWIDAAFRQRWAPGLRAGAEAEKRFGSEGEPERESEPERASEAESRPEGEPETESGEGVGSAAFSPGATGRGRGGLARRVAAAVGLVTVAVAGAVAAVAALTAAPKPVLRACADPNNMPFTNARGEGFENRVLAVLADELGARLEYTWRAQRRGFVRETLRARACDVVAGLPAASEMALVTAPYYRSTYVFVQPADAVPVLSLDDPALSRLRVGVQLVGDDYANSPPAHALARRGIVTNVRGFTVYGDYRDEAPAAAIVDAVARGEVDVALVWGPLAGYFAPRLGARRGRELALRPVSPAVDPPLPFVFDMAMGVRRGNTALRDRLQGALDRRRAEVDAILAAYGVPRVDSSPVAVGGGGP